MANQQTSLLDAVNTCLAAIGEAPVNSTTSAELVTVVLAKQFIEERSRLLQSRSWKFNTDIDYSMTRDTDGRIPIPANVVRIDSTDQYSQYDVVVRGQFLYDRAKRTDIFDQNIKCNVTWMFSFEDLPQHARWLITVQAARVLQARILNSRELGVFTEQDESQALVLFNDAEQDTGDYNVLRDSHSVSFVLRRAPDMGVTNPFFGL